MRHMVAVLVALSVAVPHAPAGAQARARPVAAVHATAAEVPPVVTAGLNAYRASGLRAALDAWMKGSPLAGNSAANAQMVQAFAPIEASYGRMIGHDIVSTIAIGSHVRRVYAVLLYQRGPVFASFDCYRSPTGWIIPGFLTHTKPQEILPAALLAPGGAVP